jgi:hypothetical protein
MFYTVHFYYYTYLLLQQMHNYNMTLYRQPGCSDMFRRIGAIFNGSLTKLEYKI